MLDIIIRKKNKEALSYDELKYAFNNYLSGKIPDYQMSALLMAITINGMNMSETLALTDIFIRSGETYDLSSIAPHVVDNIRLWCRGLNDIGCRSNMCCLGNKKAKRVDEVLVLLEEQSIKSKAFQDLS